MCCSGFAYDSVKVVVVGSIPPMPPEKPTWLDAERRRTRNPDHAGAKPVVGSCNCYPWSVTVASDRAKVVDQVQLPAGMFENEMTLELDGQAAGCNPAQVGSIPTGVS